MGKVDLKELAEQMDCMMDEWSYYVNKKTGEILSIADRHISFAENPENIPEKIAGWERNEIEQAAAILDGWADLIRFPSKYDMNEYRMMEGFIRTVRDLHTRDCLEVAIEGRGAFKRFKDTAHRFGVIDDWYEYKNRALLAYAKEWCEWNGLQYNYESVK